MSTGLILKKCCCRIGPMAIWWLPTVAYDMIKAYYSSLGIGMYPDTWTGDLNDYGLLFLTGAHFSEFELPSGWWDVITGGDWEGRIVIMSEASVVPIPNAQNIVDQSGISVIPAIEDGGLSNAPTVGTHPLISGISRIRMAFTSNVSGGTTLSVTNDSGTPWIATNKIGGISWVVAGDANWIQDDYAAGNYDFFWNLYYTSV